MLLGLGLWVIISGDEWDFEGLSSWVKHPQSAERKDIAEEVSVF
jgi:hypothetical protein